MWSFNSSSAASIYAVKENPTKNARGVLERGKNKLPGFSPYLSGKSGFVLLALAGDRGGDILVMPENSKA
jgi:Tol biopolymer transport system component